MILRKGFGNSEDKVHYIIFYPNGGSYQFKLFGIQMRYGLNVNKLWVHNAQFSQLDSQLNTLNVLQVGFDIVKKCVSNYLSNKHILKGIS